MNLATIKKEVRDFVGNVLQWPADLIGGGWGGLSPSGSGVVVTEYTALQLSAFVACVRVISDQVASLPLKVYKRSADGADSTVAWDHPLARILHTQPNPECSSTDFRQAGQGHCLINGNAYAEMVENNGGNLAAIYLRSPFRTLPYRDKTGKLIYKTTDTESGQERIIPTEKMIHVRGMGLDGIVGLSPVKFYMRELLGADLAAQGYSSSFFANDSRPGGYLKAPGNLKNEQKLDAVTSWVSGHSRGNNNRMAVLDAGWTWEKVGVDPQEAQFIETRKFNREQIAAIFGVPVHMVGGTADGHVNLEQRNVEFLLYTIKPWLKKWEMAINAKVFPATDAGRPNRFFAKFDTTELERPTMDILTKSIQMARYAGLMSMNDGRKLLKLEPLTREYFNVEQDNPADRLWMPVNMLNVTQEQPLPRGEEVVPEGPSGNPTGAPPDNPTAPQPPATPTPGQRALWGTFEDAYRRATYREKPRELDFERCFLPTFSGIAMSGRTEDVMPLELAGFIRTYIQTLHKRYTDAGTLDVAAEFDLAWSAIGKKSAEIEGENENEEETTNSNAA